MKNKALIRIDSCKKCIHCKKYNQTIWDIADYGYDYKCLIENKVISKYSTIDDEINIPNWCPLREEINEKI